MRHLRSLVVSFLLTASIACGLHAQAADAMKAYRAKNYVHSAALFDAADKAGSLTPIDLYNAACSHALAGHTDSALRYLERAVTAGYDLYAHISTDVDLESLHSDPRWSRIMDRLRTVLRTDSLLPQPHRIFYERVAKGDYLGAYLAIDSLVQPSLKASSRYRDELATMRAYAASFVGDPITSHRAMLRTVDVTLSLSVSPFTGYTARSAASEILRLAAAKQIVILNEAHHVPQGRAFAAVLIDSLYELGFRYFAVEGVGEDQDSLAWRGYPILSTGFYVREPLFADLIRRALRRGFKVVPYESKTPCAPPADCFSVRDSTQAANIYGKILANDPAARVVVYAGYSHAVEKPIGKAKPMAYWLAQMTDVDPLTIDQTEMTEVGDTAREHPAYRYANAAQLVSGPTVFVNGSGEYWRSATGGFVNVDMQVFHPRTRLINGRPDWMESIGRKISGAFTTGGGSVVPATGGPYLVQLIDPLEGENAVPVDQVLVKAGARPYLAVPESTRLQIRVIAPGGMVVYPR